MTFSMLASLAFAARSFPTARDCSTLLSPFSTAASLDEKINQSMPVQVIDQLAVDLQIAPINGYPGTLGIAANLVPDAHMNPFPPVLFLKFHDLSRLESTA